MKPNPLLSLNHFTFPVMRMLKLSLIVARNTKGTGLETRSLLPFSGCCDRLVLCLTSGEYSLARGIFKSRTEQERGAGFSIRYTLVRADPRGRPSGRPDRGEYRHAGRTLRRLGADCARRG